MGSWRGLRRFGGGAAPRRGRGGGNKKLIDVLIWQLDWGESFAAIVAAARAAGASIEQLPCVATRPELFGHLAFEWGAFNSLSTDRGVGLALGPIPWSSIDRFACRHGLIGDDFDRFCELIQAMDAAFRDYHEKKSADAQR